MAFREATEQFTRTRRLRHVPNVDLRCIPMQFIRRRSCISDFATTHERSPWGAFLLASYWSSFPHLSVIQAACKVILTESSILIRGLAWRILSAYACSFEPSLLDHVFDSLLSEENGLPLTLRRNNIIQMRAQRRETELREMNTTWGSENLRRLQSSSEICWSMMHAIDPRERQAALFCGPVLQSEIDYRLDLVDILIHDANDDVAAVAAQSIANVYFATEDRLICRELLRSVTTIGADTPRLGITLYAIVSCCGLQPSLRPTRLLTGGCVEFDLQLFRDLLDDD